MDDQFDPTELATKWQESLREAHTYLTESKDPLWTEGDSATRSALVRLVAENRMVAHGFVPSSWTFRGVCRTCGPVPLDHEVGEELVGCPWCAVGSKPRVFAFKV